ncbi:plasmid replication-relaxation protein [Bacillus phage 056SW001B]|uniref:Plasmid replication-relaxation protein n=2 Tax=Gettysburgvirus TaxID=3425034 RepID=A0A5J6T7Q3_9CAUD|nr:plasmid replication-relaxation protein [Bacillus phage 019DV002]QFG05297.1 plasmid replication-relaxation protein [Bacillus phage 019DV004]QFR56535.1 plasmid replication-relaxation protein [Bacillus phage 056SW001B]
MKKFDFMTRDQLTRLHRLGSKRNANRILSDLSQYLQKYSEGHTTVYYLSKTGREYVDCQKIRKKGHISKHTVMRNEFYLYMGCPAEWKNEVKISDGHGTLIADSWFKKNGAWNFLEVDLTQTMKENRKKALIYKGLHDRGAIQQKLGSFPVVTFLTTTELRRRQLKEACKTFPSIVYTIDDIR